jgi:hypothetical protein
MCISMNEKCFEYLLLFFLNHDYEAYVQAYMGDILVVIMTRS